MAGDLELIEPDWPAPARRARRGDDARRRRERRRIRAASISAPTSATTRRPCAKTAAASRAALELPDEPLWLNQVHGATVATRRRRARRRPPTPWSQARAGQVCAVLTADCLPVLFCNEAGTRVAAAHAGWRGLAAGVLEATVAALGRGGAPPGKPARLDRPGHRRRPPTRSAPRCARPFSPRTRRRDRVRGQPPGPLAARPGRPRPPAPRRRGHRPGLVAGTSAPSPTRPASFPTAATAPAAARPP